MPKDEKAHVDSVIKQGEGYKVTGTHKGKRASFYVHATTIESMSRKDANSFMQRNIAHVARLEE